MALVKVKPTSAGRRALVKVVNARPAQGRAGGVADRDAEARIGPQQQRPHHDAAQGRRPQAALPHRRFQAQQGRHRGEGRAPRIRPEPQRAHRACCCTPTASAATSSRRAASRSARSCMSRRRGADQAGQHAAAAQHPGRHDDALRRDAAGQGRADRALGRRLGAAAGARRHLRAAAACAPARSARCTSTAARRSAKSATKSTTCARSARRAQCAGAASVRRCAASR